MIREISGFTNLDFTDTGKFVLNATNSSGRSSTQLTYHAEKEPAIAPYLPQVEKNGTDTLMIPYLENSQKQKDVNERLGLSKAKMLKEVKIKAVKENNNYASSNLNGPGHADVVLHAEQLQNTGGTLSVRLQGQNRSFDPLVWSIGRIYTIFSNGQQKANGRFFRWHKLLVLTANPENVETVEVLNGANASIYGLDGGDGVIVITTKQGEGITGERHSFHRHFTHHRNRLL